MLDGKSSPRSASQSVSEVARPRGQLPVLVILHQEHSTPGYVGRSLLAKGHTLDVRRPRFGDPLPETLTDHAGAVIFGGPMSANDADDFVRREIELIGLALREQRPMLGICLGAQMMAAQLGARVATHPDSHVEYGYHPIAPRDGDLPGGRWPRHVYQWHKEGFDLPRGAVALATGDGPFANQAFRYGTAAIGVQFHPEITYAMVARWSGRNEHRLADLQGAWERPRQLADHVAHGPHVQRWVDVFLDDWLALAIG